VTGTGGGGVVIVSVTLTNLVVSVSEVAVMVTLPPDGTTEGAVYVVSPCDAVEVALNEPQILDPQVAVQNTPAATGSLVTPTSKLSVVLTSKDPEIADAEIGTPLL
jgi:hypothetical protein